MEKDESLIAQGIGLLVKSWAWIFYICIGMLGKLGLMLQKKEQKRLGWEDLGSILVAGFMGTVTSLFCMIHYPAPPNGYSAVGAIAVPIATLLSDKGMLFLTNLNWSAIINIILGKKVKDIEVEDELNANNEHEHEK